MKKIILTGDRPTGKLHLGHYIGSLFNRLALQDTYQQYIMIADVQALTDNFSTPKKVIDNIYEVALDYVAVGIDPNKSNIFIQSQVPELTELTIYFLNLVTLGRLGRNPTVKNEIKEKNYNTEIPVGFFCYPISQAADISAFKADLVPVGQDQIPMIEQTNEIVRRFNHIYNTDCLKETKPYLSETSRLPGIDGKAKMSKSLNNAIYLSDSPEVIKQKIFSMFTDPNHLKVSDPGKVEGNMVFTYLDIFHKNKEEVRELKAHYSKGGLGDVTLKNLLCNTIQDLLMPIREKRKEVNLSYIKDILYTSSQKARQRAKETLDEVREIIGLNYFSSK